MLPAEVSSAPIVHEGVRFNVHRLSVPGSDGASHAKDIVAHPGSVVILPIVDDERVVLIENHRVAVGEALWELPAGTLEPGEDPAACAEREIIEETGYRAARLKPLLTLLTSPGMSTEQMHGFVATGLEQVGQRLDASERITPHVVPWSETMQMLRAGRITDAKTIATLLFYRMVKE